MVTSHARVYHLFNSAAGFGQVNNLFAAGDPDVRFLNGRWVMYFGAAYGEREAEGVRLFTARLPACMRRAWTLSRNG